MAYLLSLPVLVIGLMLQLAVFSQLPLLHGTTDIVLLILIAWALQEHSGNVWLWAMIGGGMVSAISAVPTGVPLVIYLIVVGGVRLVNRRINEFPILGMLILTILATFFQHLVEIVVLFIAGTSLPFSQSIVLVTLPSVLLNLIFALPVYAILNDLAKWVYPVEVKI